MDYTLDIVRRTISAYRAFRKAIAVLTRANMSTAQAVQTLIEARREHQRLYRAS
jgi:hypothetical protein